MSQYASRQRTGFGEAREYAGAGGAPERIEIYIVPAGTELVGRVLRAARGAGAGAEAEAALEATLPGGATEIGEGQLLLLLIHKRVSAGRRVETAGGRAAVWEGGRLGCLACHPACRAVQTSMWEGFASTRRPATWGSFPNLRGRRVGAC